MSLLTDLQALSVLPKPLYCWPLANASYQANGSEIMLSTSDNRALLTEYFRISRGVPFSLNDGVQASLTTMLGLAAGKGCQLALTCSPYRTMETNHDSADDWTADWDADNDAFAARIDTVAGWINGAMPVGAILVDNEVWRTKDQDVDSMKAKHKRVYDQLHKKWPQTPIVFYGMHSVQYSTDTADSIFGNNDYYDKSEQYEFAYPSCRMYEPAELQLTQQLYQQSVKLAAKRNKTSVIPLISLGWNIKRGFDLNPPSVVGNNHGDGVGYEWYNKANSYQLGWMLFNAAAASAPNRYLPSTAAPFVYLYPGAFDQDATTTGSTWQDHFVQLVRGATGVGL